MKLPLRTTLVYGVLSALFVMPTAGLLATPLGWPMAFKLVLWIDLLIYAVLMARWSGRGLSAIVFPLALLLGSALWPGVYDGFFCLGLGVLSWIRSGVCFTETPLRAIAAEVVSVAGAAGLVGMLQPGSPITWALGIWLFFLMQALYFFIVSVKNASDSDRPVKDSFEQARRQAQYLLDKDITS